jgi:hypothetical protein
MSHKISAGAILALFSSLAFAHDGHDHDRNKGRDKPPPLAILQLDVARDAAAKFADPADAEKAGYVDIGVFMPQMGWHYLNAALKDDGRFDPAKPELLVYADDPCGGGKRKLVAVEYAIPLDMSKRAPAGFVGKADQWDANTTFGIWTLHAWVYEFNPDGVFAPFNPRVP